MASAIQAISAATSGSSATRTSPGLGVGPGPQLADADRAGRACAAAPETALASASTSGGLRKLVSSPYSAAGAPSGPGKSVRKRTRLPALAPRQP